MTIALIKSIEIVATDLEQEQLDRIALKAKLDQAIEEFNQVMTANELTRKALGIHFAADIEIAGKLPLDRGIESLLQEIQSKLAEVDERLKIARQKHEETIAKVPLTF